MDDLLIILRKPPYGSVDAAEAVRHAGGASGSEYKTMLYLIDGGVLNAKKGQDSGETGITGLGETLELMSDEFNIYADKTSLKKNKLTADDLIDGVKIDNGDILKEALKSSQSVMIY